MSSLTETLSRLEELARRSPEVAFQGDCASDEFYTAASPVTVLKLIEALREAMGALNAVADDDYFNVKEALAKIDALFQEDK